MFSSWLSALAQRETTLGISPPMSTPSREGAGAGRAGERVGQRRDEELAVGVDAVRLDMRVAAVPDRGRTIAVALAGAEDLREHERREVVA